MSGFYGSLHQEERHRDKNFDVAQCIREGTHREVTYDGAYRMICLKCKTITARDTPIWK